MAEMQEIDRLRRIGCTRVGIGKEEQIGDDQVDAFRARADEEAQLTLDTLKLGGLTTTCGDATALYVIASAIRSACDVRNDMARGKWIERVVKPLNPVMSRGGKRGSAFRPEMVTITLRKGEVVTLGKNVISEAMGQIALPPFAARTEGTASRDRAAFIRNLESARALVGT